MRRRVQFLQFTLLAHIEIYKRRLLHFRFWLRCDVMKITDRYTHTHTHAHTKKRTAMAIGEIGDLLKNCVPFARNYQT